MTKLQKRLHKYQKQKLVKQLLCADPSITGPEMVVVTSPCPQWLGSSEATFNDILVLLHEKLLIALLISPATSTRLMCPCQGESAMIYCCSYWAEMGFLLCFCNSWVISWSCSGRRGLRPRRNDEKVHFVIMCMWMTFSNVTRQQLYFIILFYNLIMFYQNSFW